jgi:hypothetical protein
MKNAALISTYPKLLEYKTLSHSRLRPCILQNALCPVNLRAQLGSCFVRNVCQVGVKIFMKKLTHDCGGGDEQIFRNLLNIQVIIIACEQSRRLQIANTNILHTVFPSDLKFNKCIFCINIVNYAIE